MKQYTLEQLSNPETYKADGDLFGMARRIATEKIPSDRTAMLAYRDEIVAGKYPMVVSQYRIEIIKEQVAAFEKRNADIETVKALTVPAGVTLLINEDNDTISIQSDWDGYDLGERLSRLKGRFDRDKKAWILPVSVAGSLKRVFANWQKSQGEKAKTEAAAKAERERQKAEAQRQRELQWAAEREANQKAYAAQKQAQAKAVASRVLIKLGSYKVGDLLNGKPITGFGKSWSEKILAGQLYQPCDRRGCDNEPVCVHCEKCSTHCTCDGETINYCYAYFS